MILINSLSFMLIPLNWYGLWPKKNSPKFYYFQTLATYFVIASTSLLMVINVIKYEENDDISKSACITFTGFLTFLKVHKLVAQKSEIRNLVELILDESQFIRNISDDHERKLLDNGTKRILKASKIILVMYLSTGILMTLIPLFVTKHPLLPFPAWFPCDWKCNQTCFWIVWFYQGITVGLLDCHLTCILDLFPNLLLSLIETQIDVIGYQMVKIGERNSENEHLNPKEFDQQMIQNFISFVKSHRRILNLCQLWQDVFSFVLFNQGLISCLLLCATAYELSSTNPIDAPENFIKFGLYTSCMVLQIFLPCYFGDQIYTKTSLLSQQVFDSQWLNGSEKYKKLMIIFLEKTKRPVRLTIYGYFSLKLETFTSICNFAYRLFTLLKQSK